MPGPADGRIGVGFLGAGPATQAIHLPTLARLADRFRVAAVMDTDADLAGQVAGSVGARAVTSADELLDDEDVACVVVCSPNAFHAPQAVAASERRHVRAVLCEKPLATSVEEARTVVDAVRRTGTALVVGAMHAFDPGWVAAADTWLPRLGAPHTVRSTVVLPPNAVFEDVASELVPGWPPMAPRRGVPDSARLRGSVLGLAIHDLPLIRRLLPGEGPVRVRSATPVAPFGYVIDAQVGACAVLLSAAFSAGARPTWTVEAFGADASLRLDFTPSYVHAGSATATLRTPGSTQVLPAAPRNGYEEEWRALGDVVAGLRRPPDPDGLLDDLRFAIDLAETAGRWADERQAAEVAR